MDDFDQAAQPPPAEEAPAADAPAAEHAPAANGWSNGQDAAPEVEDARIAWRRKNAESLQQRDEEEKTLKREVESKAQAYLAKFYEDRSARIAKAKQSNQAAEEASTKGPVGDTEWAKVMSMIDFSFNPGTTKEVERERFKGLLFTAKEKNVPCM